MRHRSSSCQLHSPVSLHVSTTPSPLSMCSLVSPDRHALTPPPPALMHNILKIIGFFPISPLFLPEFKSLAFIFSSIESEMRERHSTIKQRKKEETGSPHILIFSDSNFLRRPSFAISVKTGMVRFTSKSY